MILCGDIGGTKTRLSLVDNIEGYSTKHTHYFENAEFGSFTELLRSYLTLNPLPIEYACLAVAGPVSKQKCSMTNLSWSISAEEIKRVFFLEEVVLINDLSATAFAVPYLSSADFHVVQKSLPKLKNGPISVISVGTGLGESVLIWDAGHHCYNPLCGEGGHKDFAPHSDLEVNLADFYHHQYEGEHLSVEKLISGHGLVLIYEFLADRDSIVVDVLPTPHEISARAEKEKSGVYRETIDIFSELIASEASNVALQYLSSGGVVIAGGVCAKILSLIDVTNFLSRFHDKGRFSDWLKGISVVVCKNTEAPLIGAFYYLKESGAIKELQKDLIEGSLVQ